VGFRTTAPNMKSIWCLFHWDRGWSRAKICCFYIYWI